MKLVIKNFRKIRSAEIELNGITVLTGENNSGKTSIGEVLRLLLLSDRFLEREISSYLFDNIRTLLYRNRLMIKENLKSEKRNQLLDKYYSLRHHIYSNKELDNLKAEIQSDFDSFPEELRKEFSEVLNFDQQHLINLLLTNETHTKFSTSIHHLNYKAKETKLSLEDGDMISYLEFRNDECKVRKSNVCDNYLYSFFSSDSHIFENNDYWLRDNQDQFDPFIQDEKNKKMKLINKELESLLHGQFVTVNQTTKFKDNELNEPIDLDSASWGLKTMLNLWQSINNNVFTSKTIAYFDETEVSLHPKWQIAFAKVLTLISEYFGSKIVIATHNVFFMDALRLYSTKYLKKMKSDFYLCENNNGVAKIDNVSENIDIIFKSISSVAQILEEERK